MLVLALGACAFERDPDILSSPSYKLGYSDGCRTAHTRVAGIKETIHRNKVMYETEDAYRMGWGDGYAGCGGSTGASTREDVFSDDAVGTPGYDRNW